jgi:hypothetical protein
MPTPVNGMSIFCESLSKVADVKVKKSPGVRLPLSDICYRQIAKALRLAANFTYLANCR